MTGYIGDYNSFKKGTLVFCISAGLISGIIPLIRGLHWAYIVAVLGMGILSALLVYRYDWIQILGVLLLSIALIEPAPPDVLFSLLFVFGLIGGHINFRWAQNHKSLILSIIIFTLVNTLQIIYITDIGKGIRYYLITMYLIIFSIFIASYAIKRGAKNILKAYILSATLSAILGLAGYFGLFPSILLYDKYRIMALFKDPNVLGPFLIPAILIIIDDIGRKKLIRSRAYIHGLIIAINILGVIATFSRGAWVNLGVSLIAYLIISIPRLRQKKLNYKKILIYGLSCILIILLIWFFIISEEYRQFFYGRISLQTYDKGRFTTQAQGIILGIFNFLGYGPGQFEYRLAKEMGILFSAHNLYIRLLVENGIPGFITFMGVLAIILRDLIRNLKISHRPSKVYTAVLISILFGIMANSIVIDTLHWRHFWFFMGLGIASIDKGVDRYNGYPET